MFVYLYFWTEHKFTETFWIFKIEIGTKWIMLIYSFMDNFDEKRWFEFTNM